MEDLYKRKKIEKHKLFEATKDDFFNEWNYRFEQIINEATTFYNKKVFLFIDKNHPPNAYSKIIHTINN